MTQISKDRPSDVMPDDRPHVWTSFGTAFPEARHIIVNSSVRVLPSLRDTSDSDINIQISTVMQVRTLDYGMEDCRIAVTLPPPRELDSILSETQGASPSLNIWLLDSTKRADLRQMTYRTRPARVRQLGAFDITKGGNGTTEGYDCASGMPYYVELECVGDGCELDFWQLRVTDVPCECSFRTYFPLTLLTRSICIAVSLLQKSTLN